MEQSCVSLEVLEKMPASELAQHGYFFSQQKEMEYHKGNITAFASGRPGSKILHSVTKGLQEAISRRLAEELAADCDLLQYGALQGEPTFRIQLAKFLTRRYGTPVHSDNLLCTAGASQGLGFVSSHFFNKGDVVFVEDPTYFLALASFRMDQQLKVVPVPKDEDGIDTAELEKKLREVIGDGSPQEGRPFSCMLYLVSTFHNPTSTCTSPERARKIIEIARRYNVLVICDDVYNLLSWQPADEGSGQQYQSPPRLLTYDNPEDADFKGHVVSNGSVSKFMGPGMRLGWIEASDRIVKMLLKNQLLDSGGSFNHFTSGIVGTLLKSGLLDNHLDDVIDMFKTSVNAIAAVLKDEMPTEVKYRVPQGGYFFWMELPKSVDVPKLYQLCQEKYKINFAQGKNFSVNPFFNHCIRIAFSHYAPDQLADGTRKLCQAVKEMMSTTSSA
ncbi:2-aminoadipate transaminase-like isoform X2 [Diadema setosum]|uniref:2-aminoadipate transaminase-like isoform X2 n=1 Tax=Diadema setosum TaxID=31175 RepID=UPI003B3A6592